MPEGSTVPLEDLYARGLDHARGSEAEELWFPGLIRPMDPAGLTLSLRVPARLSFRAAGLEIQGPPDLPCELAWDSIDSVLIEGSRKLEILYRRRPGVRELIQFTADPRHPLFLEHALRLRAFGDPDCRFRGALRRRIEPGSAQG